MSGDSIFLVRNGELARMTAAEYVLEEDAQKLIADYPDLLGGGQITPEDPRRWILVKREAGVPRKEGGGDHWSLDHLFLDQDGTPTLVEVKRSSNREIRRMVVGQLMDYAANAARHWSIESIIEWFEETCGERSEEPASVLADLLGEEAEVEQFWRDVEGNLRSGRLRLIIAADRIPNELQAIIEFLNEQMDRTEVLGLEIRQYLGEGLQTLVPRVIGQTAIARIAKSTGDSRTYEQRLAAASSEARVVDGLLIDLAAGPALSTKTSKAARQVTTDGGTLFQLYPQNDTVEFYLSPIGKAGYDREAAELLARLADIAKHEITDAHPSVRVAALLERWSQFTDEFLPEYMGAWGMVRGEKDGS